MASFNQVILVGNLTRDPELRVTPKGTAICQFGICVNRDFKDESGQKRQEATFVDCEAWGKVGELIAKYQTKGSLCLVQGRLKLDQWEDKQTQQKRSKLKVVVENVTFLPSRGAGDGAGDGHERADTGGGQPAGGGTSPGRARTSPPPQENIDEDVPFLPERM
jgi:single-strand DNA-binding protein